MNYMSVLIPLEKMLKMTRVVSNFERNPFIQITGAFFLKKLFHTLLFQKNNSTF